MQRAIDLAEKGGVNVAPNPKVGAVIVHNEKIIGEGFHQKFGEAHAEVVAVNSVKDKSILSESEIYVTLEPCCHFGKTPPCADLLIHHHFKRVIIGIKDPFSLVNGGGIKRLKEAGIEVTVGVLEKECRFLNRRFFTFNLKKRPYIILKWAQTVDGFIDKERSNEQRIIHQISGKDSQKLVHQWRAEEKSILVGWKTIKNDNPQLNVRYVNGCNPTRIILDANLQSPYESHIFDHQQPTIIFNTKKNNLGINLHYIQLKEITFVEIFKSLYDLGISSIIVEGGRETLKSFIKSEYWDEVRVFISPERFERGLKAPEFIGEIGETTHLKRDILNIYYNKNNG